MKKVLVRLGAFLVPFMIVVTFVTTFASAATVSPVQITSMSVADDTYTPVNEITTDNLYHITINWESTASTVAEGDYFDITLPDKVQFTATQNTTPIEVKDPNGATVAWAYPTPAAGSIFGGTLHVVYTDYANTHTQIRGTFSLSALYDRDAINAGDNTHIDFGVNGTAVPLNMIIRPKNTIGQEWLNKWGGPVTGTESEVLWYVRLNYSASNMTGVEFSDSLSDRNGGDLPASVTYIANSFHLYRADFDGTGNFSNLQEVTIPNGALSIAADGHSYHLNLSGVDFSQGQRYLLQYRTTFIPGMALHNYGVLTNAGGAPRSEIGFTYYSPSNSGGAIGNLVGRIRIIKVDADNATTQLPGATFKVTSVANPADSWTLTTGADGTATSERLTTGSYTIEELTAPDGYVRDTTVYTVNVDNQSGTIKIIENKKNAHADIPVQKVWNGAEGGAVTIHLLANGVDTGKTLTLSSDNNWQDSFTGLDAYAADGSEITYTISEDEVAGYTSQITGDATQGFVVTNTQVPPTPEKPAKTRKKSNLPYTGDASSVAGVLFGSLAVLGSAVALKRLK